jgi:hypothetical protein
LSRSAMAIQVSFPSNEEALAAIDSAGSVDLVVRWRTVAELANPIELRSLHSNNSFSILCGTL